MRIKDRLNCSAFACDDVKHDCYIVLDIGTEPVCIGVALISEAWRLLRGKTGYGIRPATVKECSLILEGEVSTCSMW